MDFLRQVENDSCLLVRAFFFFFFFGHSQICFIFYNHFLLDVLSSCKGTEIK